MGGQFAERSGGSHADDDEAQQTDRRNFLARGASLAMAGGLVAGYGTFGAWALQYLHPSDDRQAWMFVARADEIAPGGSVSFESPVGVKVTLTRKTEGDASSPAASDFLALSSVCPHLGCRVHWEPHNKRFFCPCHNGTFDPQGQPTGGPPKDGNQSLPLYPLQVENGLLFIRMPIESVGRSGGAPDQRMAGCPRGARDRGATATDPLSRPPLPSDRAAASGDMA